MDSWISTFQIQMLGACYLSAPVEGRRLRPGGQGELYSQVGDLCFTSDGIVQKGVLLRHLVMPGHEEEGIQIVRWLAQNISRDLYVHVMEQYNPRAHVGKEKRGHVRYSEINRSVSLTKSAP